MLILLQNDVHRWVPTTVLVSTENLLPVEIINFFSYAIVGLHVTVGNPAYADLLPLSLNDSYNLKFHPPTEQHSVYGMNCDLNPTIKGVLRII